MNPSDEAELRSIVGEMPNAVFEYLELSDALRNEWKNGSGASDFGYHYAFVKVYADKIMEWHQRKVDEVVKTREYELDIYWNKKLDEARIDELTRLQKLAERVRQPWFIPYVELDSRIAELTNKEKPA